MLELQDMTFGGSFLIWYVRGIGILLWIFPLLFCWFCLRVPLGDGHVIYICRNSKVPRINVDKFEEHF